MANAKLLLIQDVEDLGRSGEIVSVKQGYFRNYLQPKGYAVIADKGTLRMQERLQKEREQQAVVDRKESEQIASKMNGLTIETVVKVDQEGHMFGSVSQVDVMHLLEEKGFELTKKMVKLAHPIKETGVHTIEIKLKEDVPASFTLKVIPDNAKFEVAPEITTAPDEEAAASEE